MKHFMVLLGVLVVAEHAWLSEGCTSCGGPCPTEPPPTPTETPPPTPTPTKPPITDCVNKDFLREVEGFETTGYVPKKNGVPFPESGVTIGNGIDLGTKNRKYFEDLGVDEEIIKKLEPYFGKKGQDAQDCLDDMPLELTPEEAKALEEAVTNKIINDIANAYNQAVDDLKKNDPEKANLKQFCDLTDAQRTVIVSVLFQHGSPGATPKFWSYVTCQDWAKVEDELRDFKDDFPTRRGKEADLLKNDDGTNSCVPK